MSLRFLFALLALAASLLYALFKLRRAHRAARQATAHESSGNRLQSLIASIPKGRVITFSSLAAQCGADFDLPMISQHMRAMAQEDQPPWWRVVRKEGQRGVVTFSNTLGKKQQMLLEGEGVRFRNGTCPLADYEWQPHKSAWEKG